MDNLGSPEIVGVVIVEPTVVELGLLYNFYFISLDIYDTKMQNEIDKMQKNNDNLQDELRAYKEKYGDSTT